MHFTKNIELFIGKTIVKPFRLGEAFSCESNKTVLILAGMAFSFMNSAIIQLLMIFRSDRMDYIMMWAMGSFQDALINH